MPPLPSPLALARPVVTPVRGLARGALRIARPLAVVGGAVATLEVVRRRLDRLTQPAGPPPEAVAVGAPGAATAMVEELLEDRAGEEQPVVAPADPDDLPVADWDHSPMQTLQSRIRRLGLDDLLVLRAYETAHANRLQVVTMLENRIAALREE